MMEVVKFHGSDACFGIWKTKWNGTDFQADPFVIIAAVLEIVTVKIFGARGQHRQFRVVIRHNSPIIQKELSKAQLVTVSPSIVWRNIMPKSKMMIRKII